MKPVFEINRQALQSMFRHTLALSLVFLTLAGCSNSSPSVTQNTAAPNVTANGLTINDLDASAVLTGSCDMIGKLDGGFEVQLDSSTWIAQPSAKCENGLFSIRVDKLGTKMQFVPRKKASRFAVVRRSAITGKNTETRLNVQYVPDVMPGGFAEGGGVATVTGKYILRGSFSGVQKESGTVLQSTDAKYKLILSRDKGVQ